MEEPRYGGLIDYKKLLLLFFGIIFLIASFEVIIWDYQAPNVATVFDTLYQLHQFIGLIGLVFTCYIFYKIGGERMTRESIKYIIENAKKEERDRILKMIEDYMEGSAYKSFIEDLIEQIKGGKE